ncbi:hypothetical protein GA0115239_111014 [Streptomyces sp. BpilaLS-43]|uniref:DUF6332 family protein n=1 Tax=Streptomyces sp. BpilaLS-43 TaxID=1839778 RepID=UPI00081BA98E|nr:DUF6332 family protein [Streptomyces sp. BpilaLS-43]SCD88879.1 hypothetical protein GA0115239_111014 [Streptomyces sp. BpilaLS-43]
MGRRTQAERDAVTVEIAYAVVSGCLMAAATCAGICLPALFLALPAAGERFLFIGGAVLGALVFAVRVVHVLWRFPVPAGPPGGRTGRAGPAPNWSVAPGDRGRSPATTARYRAYRPWQSVAPPSGRRRVPPWMTPRQCCLRPVTSRTAPLRRRTPGAPLRPSSGG